MTLKDSYIFLQDLRFRAYHGVMEQERVVGNDYVVSLRMRCDVSRAMQSNLVGDTISYADAYNVVKAVMEQPSQLLEHVAGRIAEALWERFPTIDDLDVSIMKVNPPMGSDSRGAGVELHFVK